MVVNSFNSRATANRSWWNLSIVSSKMWCLRSVVVMRNNSVGVVLTARRVHEVIIETSMRQSTAKTPSRTPLVLVLADGARISCELARIWASAVTSSLIGDSCSPNVAKSFLNISTVTRSCNAVLSSLYRPANNKGNLGTNLASSNVSLSLAQCCSVIWTRMRGGG